MKITKLIISIICISLIISCSSKNKFPKIEYIKELEFENYQPYSPISLIINTNKKYLLENEGAKVVAFDEDNTVVDTIGKKGKGPGELMSPMDMASINNRIMIADFEQLKLIIYKTDGTFLKNISLKFMPMSIAKSDETILVTGMGTDKIPFVLFDFNFERIIGSDIDLEDQKMQLPAVTYSNVSKSFYVFSQLAYNKKIWIYEIDSNTGEEKKRFSISTLVEANDRLKSSISDVQFFHKWFFIMFTAKKGGKYPLEIYSQNFENSKVYLLNKSNSQMRITVKSNRLFLLSPQNNMEIFEYSLDF